MMTAALAGVAAVALLTAVALLRRSRRAGLTREAADLGAVVADVFEQEWAAHFDTHRERLRRALVSGADPALRRRIGDEVAEIGLRFDRTRGTGRVAAAVTAVYRRRRERTTVTVDLPWERVPAAVRADLIRGGGGPVVRVWRADA